MKKNDRLASCRAFTLIELLTVIAVIGVLAAILIPVIGNVRDRAKLTQSVSQSRSLALGLIGLSNEKGMFPYGYNSESGRSWDDLLAAADGWNTNSIDWRELNSQSFGLHAPLDEVERGFGPPERRTDSRYWRSYSMVRNRVGGEVLGPAGYFQNDNFKSDQTRLSNLEDAAGTLLLAERFDPSNMAFNNSGAVIDSPAQQSAGDAFTLDGMYVYAFCDGHVERLKPEDTIGEGTMTRPLGMWSYEMND